MPADKNKASKKSGRKAKQKTKPYKSPPTRMEIENATRDFLDRGGKVETVKPIWIEDGDLFILP